MGDGSAPRLNDLFNSVRANHCVVVGENVGEKAVGCVQIEHGDGAFGAASFHMNIWFDGVAVVTNSPNADTGLVAVIVEVGDMKFTGDHRRCGGTEVTMEMAVTVGCPAVGKVEVAVVADMQDCTPVIDWVAKPWRAGEVAPMKVRVVQQVHEETVSHWRTLVVQRNVWGDRQFGKMPSQRPDCAHARSGVSEG